MKKKKKILKKIAIYKRTQNKYRVLLQTKIYNNNRKMDQIIVNLLSRLSHLKK